jgi:hypothetical protein
MVNTILGKYYMRYHQIIEAVSPVPSGYRRLYRGDSSKIEHFNVGATALTNLFGQGIYLTDNKRVAGDYTSKGSTDQVIFRLSGRKLTRQDVIDTFVRQIARKLDADGVDHGKEIAYWSRDVPYSDGGDFSTVTNDLRHRERAQRIAFATEKWQQMAKKYEVRVKLDGTGVIQRKSQKTNIAVFDVPERYLAAFLPADEEIPTKVLDTLIWVLTKYDDRATARDVENYVKQQKWEGETPSFRMIYTSITIDSPLVSEGEAQSAFIDYLQHLGYKGIEYVGGVSMGGGYRHRAYSAWDADVINSYRVV